MAIIGKFCHGEEYIVHVQCIRGSGREYVASHL
jgi:hypothetical protein